MFNRQAYAMGAAPNQIRQIFEYGRQQAKLLGPDKVYDFSLGNPSIPAPDKVNRSIHQLLDTESRSCFLSAFMSVVACRWISQRSPSFSNHSWP